MAGAVGYGASALVIDLGSGDMPMAEKILHLDDINAGIQEQRCRGGPEGMRREDTSAGGRTIRLQSLFHGAG